METEQLAKALKVALKGEIIAPRGLLQFLLMEDDAPFVGPPDELSDRQWEILELVEESLTNAQIATHLFLSESTVKQNLRGAYKTLGVKNRAQAARLFRQVT